MSTTLAGTPDERRETAVWSPPALFDGFKVTGLLGRGGMGSVFLAHELSLDRPVALKFLSDTGEASARERFLFEARTLARLQHANVVGVFRIGEVGTRPYIAYEFVSGQTLQELEKPLSWQRALVIGLGMARGLGLAHRRGLLHRDVKPANVIVSDAGEVKLLDFGIAKLVVPAPPPAGTTPPSSDGDVGVTTYLLGTPLYMAPEVLLDGEPASPASDVYALGLVIYELITGTSPYAEAAARSLAALMLAVRTAPPPPLPTEKHGTPAPLAHVVDRCLRRSPGERFATADEVRAALEDVHAVCHSFIGASSWALADEAAARVKSSFGRLSQRLDRLVARFYDRLFKTNPELRALFPESLDLQEAKLADMLRLAVDNLARPQQLLPMLADLGLRHVIYGVARADFAPLGDALLATLAELEGPAWTVETEVAWRSTYDSIVAGMLTGYEAGRLSSTPNRA